jgi:exosome complex exonuclease DIS3/RRP44
MEQLTAVNRIFVKRTRRGQVKTHVRQQYLRDDLPTGAPQLDDPELEPRLSATATQYLVLDTNVVLHQIDLLERPSICDVIVLQTVLEEVRHNKISLHKRLRAIIADERRRFHVFSNDFHRETFAGRKAGESPNDRNDRAIRIAAKWYQSQLGDSVEVLLLTNDAENLRLAKEAGIRAERVHEYVRKRPDASELVDVVARAPEESEAAGEGTGGGGGSGGGSSGAGGGRKGATKYALHLPMSELTRGVASGELHQGKLNISRHNSSQGSVFVSTLPGHTSVLIRDREALNRATDGDVVVVRLLPRSEWKRAGEHRLADRSTAEPDDLDAGGGGERSLGAQPFAADFDTAVETGWQDDPDGAPPASSSSSSGGKGGKGGKGEGGKGEGRACGVVVGIVKRNWRPFVCVLDPESAMGGQYLVEPLEQRIPKINITTRQPEMLSGKLLVVSIDFWEANHRFPTGHYVRTIGNVGDTGAESEAILLEHEVNTAPFSAQVQACLPAKGWQIPPEEAAKRLDLRNGRALVCSVDPPGCVDIDDALHAKELPRASDGTRRFEVGVHIADVGHFIKAGTAIDKEASLRGTTVYLVNRRIDMVPKRLGEDLCSLHEKVDRLAFSAIWEMDEEANILSTSFHKTIIKSEGALSYEQAQLRMDDTRMDDPLTTSLRTLNALAKRLKTKRQEAGALSLASPEVRFVLDSETSDPTDVGIYQHKEANSMVEEFMLLANISVAAETTRAFPQAAMLRRHPQPTPGAFDGLNASLKQHGFELDVSSSLALGNSLNACDKPADPYFNKLVRILATRSMQQARYFCSGTVPPAEYLHYGLAAPIYTHFTSPIRRYSDQMAHRLLAAIIGWEPISHHSLDLEAMGDLTDNLNQRHTLAQHAGRASVALHTLIFFRGRETVEDAHIIKVKENGVVVLVPRYGIEGIVYVCGPNETSPFVYDGKKELLRHPTCVLKSFDKVRVRIAVDSSRPHRPKLELAIVEPKLPGRGGAGGK